VRNDLILGAVLSVGRVDISDATRKANVTSVSVGAYFAKRFQSDLYLDGFVSAARPNYVVDGTKFTSTRASANLTLSGSMTGGGVKLTPSGTLIAYNESIPSYITAAGTVAANEIRNLNLNVGARLEPMAPLGNGILPYIALSVDHRSNQSTLAGKQTFTSPRLGLGFGMELGRGYFSLDMDAGNVQRNVRDFGLRASYELSF
jgi:outer membrane autotransporter protein